MEEIQEIVLTGGPCAGKTSALSRLQSWLMDRGFRVFLVPEVPTMFIQGGMQDIGSLATRHVDRYLHFQLQVLKMQMILRERFRELAAGFPEPAVIIYDRGPMDIKAYVDAPHFNHILRESGYTLSDVRDSFNAIIHLVTAAEGAEEHYTTENNSARSESPEAARALDKKTQAAWVGHPHLKIISNTPTGFDLKIKRVIAAAARILGIPVPLEIERKFLLRELPNLSCVENVQSVNIEQMYLAGAEGEQVRIRRRIASDSSAVYYRTIKSSTNIPGVRNEHEKIITAKEYAELFKLQLDGTRTIKKVRYCFLWHDQYFELDWFLSPSGRFYLEVELTEEKDVIEIPPFIDVDREITEEPGFSNYDLAKL